MTVAPPVMMPATAAIEALIAVLGERGYEVIGPTVRDGAVVLDRVGSTADLPAGWVDEQDAGTYRLRRTDTPAFFAHAVGPVAPRRFLSPPRQALWAAVRVGGGGFAVEDECPPAAPLAFLGVRACELAGIAVQDHVRDAGLATAGETTRRRQAFFVGVDCARAAATCFCASMGTGPAVTTGADVTLSELADEHRHDVLARAGSERGATVLAAVADRVPHRLAESGDLQIAAATTERTAAAQQRRLDPLAARDVLADRLEHPHWDEVAGRCLSCTNCTLVCPTCFCTAVEDVTSLDGDRAERIERWDSCFTLGHSALHGGGSVHADVRSRYRQWLVHKVSTWWDQFGESGCVGCGRCITWCPAAIDLTAEVAALTADRDEGGAP